MKVRVFVSKSIDCEIDDKFRELAIPYEKLAEAHIPEERYIECTRAVEKVTGIPAFDCDQPQKEMEEAEKITGIITAVHSLENGEVMVEM